MTPCDVICLYAKMNQNFKGGIDNVMMKYNDTVDSRGLQRCADRSYKKRRGQSSDARPVTESLVLYTFLLLYDYCAAGYALSWTFCNYVVIDDRYLSRKYVTP